jgi:HPt (histidine-containing phosphotransfer) domain-containing protein
MTSDHYILDEPQFEYLNEITGNNKEIMEQIIALFIAEAPKDLEKLLAFCQEKNWEATGKQAHKIKSSVANFGLSGLKELFFTIEQSGKQNNNIEQIPAWVDQAKSRLERVIGALHQRSNS